MRQGQQNRRGRGRNNNNHGHGGHGQNRRGQNPLSRNYESNGPGVKIRGNAAHIAEKYMSLARDALSSGDNIMAENYLQHAEHYNRIIMAAQQPAEGAAPGGMQQRPRAIPAEFGSMDDDADGDGEDFAMQMIPPTGGTQPAQHTAGSSGGAGGYPMQGQPQGFGQQHGRNNGYGQRGEGQRGDYQRQDGGRGERFGRDRDRDGGQHRSHQRHEQNRHDRQPDQSRRDQSRHEQGRYDAQRQDQPRHDHQRHDQSRQDQSRHDPVRHDQPRHDHQRQGDFGRQPQPIVDASPAAATGFGLANPLPSFVAEPTQVPFLQAQPVHTSAAGDVDRGPTSDMPRAARPADDGEQGGVRRERAPRPAVGEEGYRAPRRRRTPVAAIEASEGGAGVAEGTGEGEPISRRRPDPEVSGD